MRFFVGLHLPYQASGFAASMISVNRLERRKSDIAPRFLQGQIVGKAWMTLLAVAALAVWRTTKSRSVTA